METSEEAATMASALVVCASSKAGMEGVDRDLVNSIIMRESKNSAYMIHQQQQDKKTNQKIKKMRQQLQEFSDDDISKFSAEIDREVVNLLARQNTLCSMKVVLDMDSFYVSCALLSRPDLHHRPVCVSGGTVISTSNYNARRYGVRSAMGTWIGDKLVQELSKGKETLIHIAPDFQLYTRKSHQVQDILSEYDPSLKAYSLDEVYLDLAPYLDLRNVERLDHNTASSILKYQTQENSDKKSDCSKSLGNDLGQSNENISAISIGNATIDASAVVAAMRSRVYHCTGLTCSAGIASNFMLAKIASDKNKPDGQCYVGASEIEIRTFVGVLPIRKIPGIGRVTEKILHAFGIKTPNDLYKKRAMIRCIFKPTTSQFLLRASLGLANDTEQATKENDDDDIGRRGISRERTFAPTNSQHDIVNTLGNLAKMLADDMVKEGIGCRTISLKVKLSSFEVINRSKTLPNGCCVNEAQDVLDIVKDMLVSVTQKYGSDSLFVRLLGVRCSNLVSYGKGSSRQVRIDGFLTNESAKSKGIDGVAKTKLQSHPSIGSSHSINTPAPINETREVEAIGAPCPVCGKMLSSGDNVALNSHLDKCLSMGIIRETARRESKVALTEKKRRKKNNLFDFFIK